MPEAKLAAGTGSSLTVERCQVCDHEPLDSILFLGYLPPVNQMRTIGERPHEQPAYPAELLRCPSCELVQLGCVVDKQVLFPPEYPYTSGTTRILRDNFAEMYSECQSLYPIGSEDLVIDIGSNDGTLLANWQQGGHRVLGIEPTDMGKVARERGIPTEIAYMGTEVARRVRDEHGPASIVTATNVFAHMEDVPSIVDGILTLLADDGIFISESHYLLALVETLQYDTIYHEHLRYYSLASLAHLLGRHGLEPIHAKRIPTHGGSIRVYAARADRRAARASVAELVAAERAGGLDRAGLASFKGRVVDSKLRLHALLCAIKQRGERVFGIGAPSRASTIINYTGLDDGIVDCVMEIRGSYKIGKYMPGTLIPVLDETRLYEEQPEYALLFSWHIADELMPKIRDKGFRGRFIVPLPEPRIC